ncbi:MAG: signal peptidase I [Burkholderiaceae bacterium]|nr:signal peptidase I [Burkholderiaceae bacterium]
MSLDAILGNFPLILLILTIVTGIVWCLDVFYLAKQRRAQADATLAEFDARVAKQQADGVKPDQNGRAELAEKLVKRPMWIEYSGSFFPVIAAVFFLRSFLYEPFKIPSSSMSPTLVVGDMILVNKFAYGIRLPVINKKIINISDPQRGDVMVFKYPRDTSLDYIKRVIGVAGDKIVYRNKRLTVNGQPLTYQPLPDYLDTERLSYSKQFDETLFNVKHRILNDTAAPNFVPNPDSFPGHELCSYNAEGFACTVPPGHYFMMGDNRDNSLDSRFWGFVPDNYIVGRASIIWLNLNNLKRIGSFQ